VQCHFPWVHGGDAGRHGGPDACPFPVLFALPGGGSSGTELLPGGGSSRTELLPGGGSSRTELLPGGRSSGTELLFHPLWCPLSACLGGR
jgi:hypothetical protein